MSYVNLHNHTEYSLMDGLITPEELVAFAVENNQPAIAMTDHGVMGGYWRFYKTAKEADINPLIGIEFHVAKTIEEKSKNYHHLVAIAKNETGLKNLFILSSLSHVMGFYYKPKIDWNLLVAHKEGLIVTSACMGGVIAQLILKGHFDKAKEWTNWLKSVFGDDFYLEMQPFRTSEQVTVNKGIIEIANETNVKKIVASDAHYFKNNVKAHNVLLNIQTQGRLKKFDDDTCYPMTEKEIKEYLSYLGDISDCLANTIEIADKCNLEITAGKNIIPRIYRDEKKALYALAREGWIKRNIPNKSVYVDRIKYELKEVERLDFMSYFLFVHSLVDWVKKEGIYMSPGRGSAAGSLICYLLGITEVDPVKYNLLFTRFIAPDRITSPDIDMDFEHNRRDEIKNHLIEQFGRDCVADVGTYTIFKGRLVLRDVSRVFEVPISEVNKISGLIVQRSSGDARSSACVEDSFEEFEECRTFHRKYPHVLEHCKKLEGRTRQAGIHASAVVVAPFKLMEHTPLENRKGKIVTALDGKDIDELGFLKLDILGLKTLTVLKNTTKVIGKNYDWLLGLNLNDKTVLDKFHEGDNTGIFQFNSEGMIDTCKEAPINSFDDLITLNALYRPGGMRSGICTYYIMRKNGKQKVERIHPIYDEVTTDTLGLIIYQEQCMGIFARMAGYSAINVDRTRRTIAKSHGVEELEQQREVFVNGCKDRNIDEKLADQIFDMILHFGSYGFNKSHSVCYTQLAYWMQYLKAHYPLQFYLAALSEEEDNNTTRELIADLRTKNIKFLLPQINKSRVNFTCQDGALRAGLNRIKGIGEKAAQEIVDKAPYKNMDDLKAKVSLRVVNSKVREIIEKTRLFSEESDYDAMSEFYPLPFLLERIANCKQKASKYDLTYTNAADMSDKGGDFYIRGLITSVTLNKIGDFIRSSNYKWSIGERYAVLDFVDGTSHLRIRVDPDKYKIYKDSLKVNQMIIADVYKLGRSRSMTFLKKMKVIE